MSHHISAVVDVDPRMAPGQLNPLGLQNPPSEALDSTFQLDLQPRSLTQRIHGVWHL